MSTQAPPRPVAVLGMHRSGTSLAANVLEELGVDLGPSETMLPTNGVENLRGYFEQRAIRELNDELLEALGGSWFEPPPLAAAWEHDAALEPLRRRARELYEGTFASDARPGFKDPRLSFTLPFWRRVAGPLDCIVCVRPAAAIEASLRRRYRRGPQRVWPWHPHRRRDWQALARLYADAAMEATREERRVVIGYDDWFGAPEAQLRRLSEFLGGATPDALARATRLVDPEQRHHGLPA